MCVTLKEQLHDKKNRSKQKTDNSPFPFIPHVKCVVNFCFFLLATFLHTYIIN